MFLSPYDDGVFRFAAISRTALGTPAARPDELRRFYERLPDLGIDRVFHLGGVSETAHPSIASLYPRIEGVATYELLDGAYAPCGGRMRASGRLDWSTTPSVIPLASGAPRGS